MKFELITVNLKSKEEKLWGDRRFRTFNVVDDFNREELTIEVDFNLLALLIVRTLDNGRFDGPLNSIRW